VAEPLKTSIQGTGKSSGPEKETIMKDGFVWFHNSSDNPSESSKFYESLLGWTASQGPGGLTMLRGKTGQFAGMAKGETGSAGWIPYAQVDDVDAMTKAAVRLGATMITPKTRGPLASTRS
jgi:predicted enzyme related to lactoylglutathione lyase